MEKGNLLIIELELEDSNGIFIRPGDIVEYKGDYKTRISSGENIFSPWYEKCEIVWHKGSLCAIILEQHNSYFGDLPSKPKNINIDIYQGRYTIIGKKK